MIRILLVDDHEIVRKGLQVFLNLQEDFLIIGEAKDGQEAVERYRQQKPDVVLLDLQMEPVDGLTALRQIKEMDEQAKVIVLTSFLDPTHVLPAVESGAMGYLVKTTDAQAIALAIRNVVVGKSMFDAELMQSMAKGIRERADLQDLTPRELDVLGLLAKGLSNQEIADTLVIGIKTVKTHVSNILAKLGLQDRTQAAVYAIEHGVK